MLEQKQEFLERQLEEAQRREKELSAEVKNQKRDHFNSVKDMQGKLEQQIKDLQRKAEEQSEQLFEWESRYQDLETRFDQATSKYEESEAQKVKDITKLRDTLSDTQRNYDVLKKKYTDEVEHLKASSEEDSSARTERIRELEADLKSLEDNLEIANKRWEKD